jgi:hypothetical protein
MDLHKRYTEVSLNTEDNLKSVVQSLATVGNLSQLSLLEVDPLLKQVGHLVPAGNVPSLILRGLARLPGRRLSQKIVRRDVDLLFKGIEQTLDKAVYTAFFAGPAAVIWGYQNLLKLSGKDLSEAFPEGLWQFYADYALREDTARHANETHGFDTFLNQHQIQLDKVDRATAWVMAAIQSLHQYEALLENEWRERVYIRLLIEETRTEPDAARYLDLHRDWQSQLPYGPGPDVLPGESYPAYRRRKFDQFLVKKMAYLSPDLRLRWAGRVNEAEQVALPAYVRQISILAYLEPGPYGETRVSLLPERVHVGLIYQGHYYLIPICTPGTGRRPELQTVRAMLTAILSDPPEQGAGPARLAEIKRAAWPGLRRKLNGTVIENLDRLRLAPILLNLDPQPRHLPLSEVRQAERGAGDHALTLFDTGETFVFDQSHIFFDGGWGAALAEIMTQEALAWADQLHYLKGRTLPRSRLPELLTFEFDSVDQELIRRAPKVMSEASAETDLVDLDTMLKLRQRFKQRNDQIQLTVNDLLVLYRAVHAATYEPDPGLVAELENLAQVGAAQSGALAALEAIHKGRHINPTIAIPVDVSHYSPRDRLQPITFEVPLKELELLDCHQNTIAALEAYKHGPGNRDDLFSEFYQLRQQYLTHLTVLGVALKDLKEAAAAGETASSGTLRLLAHLPTSLQRMLDKVPGHFELLNDLIKGREAFSNIGAVAPASSLTRFISAKDDNDKKILVWGVLTDAEGVMRLSLRDFRPHVGLLIAAGHKELATRITRDYLESYARGLNKFIGDLYRTIKTSHETS